MITKEELEKAGYKEELCKVGYLYFNGLFFCKFCKDGVDYRACNDDMTSLGIAKSMDEIRDIEKQYFIKERKKLLDKVEVLDKVIERYK